MQQIYPTSTIGQSKLIRKLKEGYRKVIRILMMGDGAINFKDRRFSESSLTPLRPLVNSMKLACSLAQLNQCRVINLD